MFLHQGWVSGFGFLFIFVLFIFAFRFVEQFQAADGRIDVDSGPIGKDNGSVEKAEEEEKVEESEKNPMCGIFRLLPQDFYQREEGEACHSQGEVMPHGAVNVPVFHILKVSGSPCSK